MDIIICRQSVCMGDDAHNHTLTYTINSFTKFSDIFQDLIKQNYFPNISGNDVVWTLLCGEHDLMSWKTKENKLYGHFITKEPTILSVKSWATPAINFSYYSSPINRAQKIFTMFNGSKFHIWREGFMAEYKSYYIPQTLETDWRNTLLS